MGCIKQTGKGTLTNYEVIVAMKPIVMITQTNIKTTRETMSMCFPIILYLLTFTSFFDSVRVEIGLFDLSKPFIRFSFKEVALRIAFWSIGGKWLLVEDSSRGATAERRSPIFGTAF